MFVLASLCYRYALALYDNPDLSRLWEGVSSLTVSSKGAVYLQANPRLCSHDVEALNQSFAGRIDEDLVHYTSATGREVYESILSCEHLLFVCIR